MAHRRVTCTASALALCLASVVVSAAEIDIPPPADPAPVVITAADLGLIDIPLPEPAPVVLDIAAAPKADDAPAESAHPADEASPASVAALPRPADRPSPLETQVDPEAALPAPPQQAAPDLSDIAAAPGHDRPRSDAPQPSIVAVPAPQPDEPPAAPPAVIAAPAAAVLDLAPHIAQRIQASVRSNRLPDRDEQAIRQFYAERGHHPLWVEAGGFTARGKALQAQLAAADADGLRASDYVVAAPSNDPAALANADVALSVAAALYARDARGGRLEPRRISALMTPKLELPVTAELMARLADSADPAAILAGYLPQHEGYRRLKDKLAQVRAGRPAAAPMVRIPSGPAIRLGMRDERVRFLRARFGLGESDDRTYDRALATQVAEFQRENGLPPSGVLNRQTQDVLNGGPAARLEGDLIAAMERWRWLPADLGADHVIVNVPEYMVRKVEDGQVVHAARVVVGRPERPTPIFSDMMDHLVVNPSWTLPPTILREDVLPKLAADPGYAERRGFEVIRRGANVIVRQPPGPSNALGVIKLMFPNDHAVYLHDTPTRSHFAHSRRAYSSGCVRVERPLKLAELVLGGPQAGWSEQRLRGMVGFGERTIRLQNRMPIHLVYMTHEVSADGTLTVHEDIYGFHQRTRTALGL